MVSSFSDPDELPSATRSLEKAVSPPSFSKSPATEHWTVGVSLTCVHAASVVACHCLLCLVGLRSCGLSHVLLCAGKKADVRGTICGADPDSRPLTSLRQHEGRKYAPYHTSMSDRSRSVSWTVIYGHACVFQRAGVTGRPQNRKIKQQQFCRLAGRDTWWERFSMPQDQVTFRYLLLLPKHFTTQKKTKKQTRHRGLMDDTIRVFLSCWSCWFPGFKADLHSRLTCSSRLSIKLPITLSKNDSPENYTCLFLCLFIRLELSLQASALPLDGCTERGRKSKQMQDR